MRGSYTSLNFHVFRIKMLMFNSGLLSTFIPEILMVLGYFFCLVTPHFQDNKGKEINSDVVNIFEIQHHNKIATPPLSTIDYSNCISIDFISDENRTDKVFWTLLSEYQSHRIILKSSSPVSFEQFSRPPPPFFS